MTRQEQECFQSNPAIEGFPIPNIYEALIPGEVRNLPKLRFSFSDVAIVYEIRQKRRLIFNGNITKKPDDQVENVLQHLLEAPTWRILKHKQLRIIFVKFTWI